MVRDISRRRMGALDWIVRVIVSAAVVLTLASCSFMEKREYDISVLFRRTPEKCQEYDGEQRGSACWVTLAQCEKATSDYRKEDKYGVIDYKCK